MPRIRSFLGAVALVAVALSTSTAFASSAKSVCLRLHDLPSGYKQLLSDPLSNVTQAGYLRVKKVQIEKHGRIGGYIREFILRPQIIEVASFVSEYHTPAGAHWE